MPQSQFDRADHLLLEATYAAYALVDHNDPLPWTRVLRDTGDDARPFIVACYDRALRAARCRYCFSVAVYDLRCHFQDECVVIQQRLYGDAA